MANYEPWEPHEFMYASIQSDLDDRRIANEFKRLWPRTTLLMCDELDSLMPRHNEWRLIFQSMNATLIAENNG